MHYVLGRPTEPGWSRCDAVTGEYLAAWQQDVIDAYTQVYGVCSPQTAVGHVLIYYADIAATIGALCLRIDKRVPKLGRDALAFRRRSDYSGVDGVALLDPGFWCLPDDRAAAHPDAIPVDDLEQLTQRLRHEIRRHADDFLTLLPGRRLLARRYGLGAFLDSLDSGLRLQIEKCDAMAAVALAQTLLPGNTAEFRDASRLQVAPADSPAALSQRRVSCCYFDKAAGTEQKCLGCPRTAR